MWFHPSLDSSGEMLQGSIDVLHVRALELNSGHAFLRCHACSFLGLKCMCLIKIGRKWGLNNQVHLTTSLYSIAIDIGTGGT